MQPQKRPDLLYLVAFLHFSASIDHALGLHAARVLFSARHEMAWKINKA